MGMKRTMKVLVIIILTIILRFYYFFKGYSGKIFFFYMKWFGDLCSGQSHFA